MARVMIDRAGFSIECWYLVLKHDVLITNLILLESVEPDTAKAKRERDGEETIGMGGSSRRTGLSRVILVGSIWMSGIFNPHN